MLDDPDRFVIALMFVFQTLYRLSGRKAAELAVAFTEGDEVAPPQDLQRQEPGWTWLSLRPQSKAYKKDPTKPTLRRFEMRGRALRQKASRLGTSAEAAWFCAVTWALMLTITARRARDLDAVTCQVGHLTNEIGERQFAELNLLPALEALRPKLDCRKKHCGVLP
ncbi:MAG: hypothetical protein ACREDO_01620 [Methyloceanibacter sp.]